MQYHYGCRCELVRLPKFPVSAPSFKEIVVNGDSSVEEKNVPSNTPLPDPETVDLESILKAGIPLQRTNTKVIQSDLNLFTEVANSEEFVSEETQTTETQTTQTSEV